jgi:hypothetical protein
MEEKIGRDTLLELIQLQINILDDYKALLKSDERRDAKEALNDVVKAAILAVKPMLTLQHLAYGKVVDLHEKAVQQTRDLLEKLRDEEKARADIHKRMRDEAERARREREHGGPPR